MAVAGAALRPRRHRRPPDHAHPHVEIFTRSKLPWVTLPEGVPAFEVYYDHEGVVARGESRAPARDPRLIGVAEAIEETWRPES